MGKRTYLDPALLPEARMDRMREEVYLLRRTVLSLVPEPFREIIVPPENPETTLLRAHLTAFSNKLA